MARIVLADDGIEFDGRTLDTRPLGGVESSVIALTQELARRGHEVLVRNKCREPLLHQGVSWAPIASGLPDSADLYIANRGDKLIPLMPRARRTVFWIHNPANYLLKWRYLSKLFRFRPAIVFIGSYHASTYPRWAPAGERVVIPYGIPEAFRGARPLIETPPPRAIFASNPLRSLDWLLELWAGAIHPQLPEAELHVFSGASTYGAVGASKTQAMAEILDRAMALVDKGVVLRRPVPKAELIRELRASRLMLYRGDINETFCLAVGEAQAMGVPTVVQDLGSVVERVIDGTTGFVCRTGLDFAAAATRLLTDDALWRRQHEAALASQGAWGWPEAADAFERLMP